MGEIFSPGKLLLSSEYVVLDGALALAIPTKWGQEFFFEEISGENSLVKWKACHQGKLWLEATIDYRNECVLATNHPGSADFVLRLLLELKRMGAQKLQSEKCYTLRTNLQFPPDFGLGSSSTLINNIAHWADVDAFVLNEKCLGGSGYDVAVAKEKSAILYEITDSGRIIQPVTYAPEFSNELLFVHLNQKQNSREGIRLYKNKTIQKGTLEFFTKLTLDIYAAKSLTDFSALMVLHEEKLSELLGLKTAKSKWFSDCPVFIKSLGAWGGDFILTQKFSGYESYFRAKGFEQFFSWEEIIRTE